jgi:hypothetical protein
VSEGDLTSGNAIVGNEEVIGEGGWLLLHGFTVWFERTGLPCLHVEGKRKSHARTWYVLRKDDEHGTFGAPAVGRCEWEQLEKLRRWLNAPKTYEANTAS